VLVLAFVVTLRSGRRYTVKAEELRCNEGCLELWGFPPSTEAVPYPGKQVVGLFALHEVVAVVTKENLLVEERGEPTPYVVGDANGSDPIPF
jgi:hypothetical protein